MGKPGQRRRDQIRMTAYNIAKSRIEFQNRTEYIETLQTETINLKLEILDLQVVQDTLKKENVDLKGENSEFKLSLEKLENKHCEDMKVTLQAQKDDLSKRHKMILKHYSEELEAKYKESFNITSNNCKSETSKLKTEIQRLSMELLSARRAILTAGVRRPIYSPGKYTENG